MIGEPEKQAKSVIVDYGSGNLKSVFNAFKHASSGDVSVTHDFRDLSLSSHIILPGVGSFADCMKGLVSLPGVIETLHAVDMQAVQNICLEEGVWLRPFGRLIYTMPPFITEAPDLVKVTSTMKRIAKSSV